MPNFRDILNSTEPVGEVLTNDEGEQSILTNSGHIVPVVEQNPETNKLERVVVKGKKKKKFSHAFDKFDPFNIYEFPKE